MYIKLKDGTQYEFDVSHGRDAEDSFLESGSVLKPGMTEWVELTESELEECQDRFSDELYEDYFEHCQGQADDLYDSWKESQYE